MAGLELKKRWLTLKKVDLADQILMIG